MYFYAFLIDFFLPVRKNLLPTVRFQRLHTSIPGDKLVQWKYGCQRSDVQVANLLIFENYFRQLFVGLKYQFSKIKVKHHSIPSSSL